MCADSSGGRGHRDLSTLQNYPRGANFPAEKEEIAQAAESNGAPQEDLVGQIRNANTERFDSAEEVMQSLQRPSDTADPV